MRRLILAVLISAAHEFPCANFTNYAHFADPCGTMVFVVHILGTK
jgi:hypothetical protein